MKRTTHVGLLLFIVAITLLVGSRLRMSVNPNFMFQEQYGLAYNFAPRLGALCDPNPLKGLEGPTSNVTDQRSLSLLYVVPTKLLRHSIDTYVLHRIIGVAFFALTLLGLWGLARTLSFTFFPTMLLLTTVGFSTQLISYLYESKLTITSAAWFTFLLLSLAALDSALRRQNIRKATLLLFIFPLLIALSYETYTVSRPLAVIALSLIGSYRLWCNDTRGYRLRFTTIFLGSAIFSGFILKLLHPGIRFDQTLFEGRTESLVTPSGTLFGEWRETILARIKEVPAIFEWSPSYFSSETLSEAGSLELWLALAAFAAVTISTLCGADARRSREILEEHKRFYLMVVVLAGAALTIPLLSITYIRGHRLFGLYICGALLLAVLVHALLKSEYKTLRHGSILATFLMVGVIVFYRTPLLLAWQPPAHFTPPFAHETIAALRTLPLPETLTPRPDSVLVRICDEAVPPSWEHFWNAALYVSDYGCKLGGATTRLSCDCESREFTDGLRGIVCLSRTSRGSEVALTTRYIEITP